MVFKGSRLIVADNSGAKIGKCIKVNKKHKWASSGDIILITLSKFKKRSKKIKKRSLYLGIIISTKF